MIIGAVSATGNSEGNFDIILIRCHLGNYNPADTRRCFDVDSTSTSFEHYGRQMDVETNVVCLLGRREFVGYVFKVFVIIAAPFIINPFIKFIIQFLTKRKFISVETFF